MARVRPVDRQHRGPFVTAAEEKSCLLVPDGPGVPLAVGRSDVLRGRGDGGHYGGRAEQRPHQPVGRRETARRGRGRRPGPPLARKSVATKTPPGDGPNRGPQQRVRYDEPRANDDPQRHEPHRAHRGQTETSADRYGGSNGAGTDGPVKLKREDPEPHGHGGQQQTDGGPDHGTSRRYTRCSFGKVATW